MKAKTMRRARKKTLGKSLQIPRALTILYGKNPDPKTFFDKTFNTKYEKQKKIKSNVKELLYQTVMEELHFKRLVKLL